MKTHEEWMQERQERLIKYVRAQTEFMNELEARVIELEKIIIANREKGAGQ